MGYTSIKENQHIHTHPAVTITAAASLPAQTGYRSVLELQHELQHAAFIFETGDDAKFN